MLYAIAAAFILGIVSGAAGMRQWDSSEILVLESAIQEANTQSEVTLKLAQVKVEAATKEAEHLNTELEKSYEQSIATVNSYFDRVRNNRAASRPNPVPSCESAGTPETTAAEFAETAYRIEAYAQNCWRFVENECGIRTKE